MTASAGNGERFAAQPVPEGGTPVSDWIAWGRRFGELDLSACPALVLVAPHPDDETLGLGGTAALLQSRGVDVQVVSVSDGGAAFPDLTPIDRATLERARRSELYGAAELLGIGDPICLGLPDGELSDHESRLAALLTKILQTRPVGTWLRPRGAATGILTTKRLGVRRRWPRRRPAACC